MQTNQAVSKIQEPSANGAVSISTAQRPEASQGSSLRAGQRNLQRLTHSATPYPVNHPDATGLFLPEARHLITKGTLGISYPDGSSMNISYKELNPKMDGIVAKGKVSKDFQEAAPVLARNLMYGYPGMIFLDSEVDPVALQYLMSVPVPVEGGGTKTLGDYYSFGQKNPGDLKGATLDPYRGCILYRTDQFQPRSDAPFDPSKNQYETGRDTASGGAGMQPEYVSQFGLMSKDGKPIDIWLGKGPHYAGTSQDAYGNSAAFLADGHDDKTGKDTGLFRALVQGAAASEAETGAKVPAIAIGDWNNELNSSAIHKAVDGTAYESYVDQDLFQNLYDPLLGTLDAEGHILPHDGSDFANDMNNALAKHNDIPFSTNPSDTAKQARVNTQVLSFTGDRGYSVQMIDAPEILYGDRNHPEEESSCGFWGEPQQPIPAFPSDLLV